MENQYFQSASQQLEQLVESGFFGKEAQTLTAKRDVTPINQYLYECFINIFKERQYGCKNVIGIMTMLCDLYSECVGLKRQPAVNLLSSFVNGTPDAPELECLSSYTEFLFLHTKVKNIMSGAVKNGGMTDVEKKQAASEILNAYSKGVELVGKAFARLVCVLRLTNGKNYDLISVSRLTLYQKIDEYLKMSNGRYDKITTVVNRELRNADSHLDAYYMPAENSYIVKVRDNGAVKMIRLPMTKMMLEIYPKIGWFVQAYISSCILIVLSIDNNELFTKAITYILEINNDPTVI